MLGRISLEGSFKGWGPVADKQERGLFMPVQLICPNLNCRKFLSVPEEVRGKLVKCQHCQTNFRVPDGQKKLDPVPAAKR